MTNNTQPQITPAELPHGMAYDGRFSVSEAGSILGTDFTADDCAAVHLFTVSDNNWLCSDGETVQVWIEESTSGEFYTLVERSDIVTDSLAVAANWLADSIRDNSESLYSVTWCAGYGDNPEAITETHPLDYFAEDIGFLPEEKTAIARLGIGANYSELSGITVTRTK